MTNNTFSGSLETTSQSVFSFNISVNGNNSDTKEKKHRGKFGVNSHGNVIGKKRISRLRKVTFDGCMKIATKYFFQ